MDIFRKLWEYFFPSPQSPYIPEIGDIVSIPGLYGGEITYEIMDFSETEPRIVGRRAYHRGHPENEGTRINLFTSDVKLFKKKN